MNRQATVADVWSLTMALAVPLMLVLLIFKAMVVSHWDQPSGANWETLVRFFVADLSLTRLMGFGLIGFVIGWLFKPRVWWRGPVGFIAAVFLAVATMALRMWVDGRSAWESGILRASASEIMNMLKIAWEDMLFSALFALLAFAMLWVTSTRFRRAGVTLVGFTWLLLLTLIGWELAYYFKTGGTGSGQLVLYLIEQRAKLAGIIGGELDSETLLAMLAPYAAVPLAWGLWLHWRGARNNRPQGLAAQAETVSRKPARHAGDAARLAAGVALLLAGSAALPVQPPSTHYSRFSTNTFFTVGRDLFGVSAHGTVPEEVLRKAKALQPYADVKQIRLVAGEQIKRLNVVVIMLESVRADKTSVHAPELGTTPFLSQLAHRGLMVENMHAVLPRTANAWISVLTGTHGTDLGGVGEWARADKEPLFHSSLARLLRPLGYKSAFFTPTHLDVESDHKVMAGFGFDKVSLDVDLDATAFERPISWGFEDRAMLKPILQWMKERRDARENALTVVMTNIVHHPYKAPSTWPLVDFPAVTNPQLNAYLNCLRYIDQWLRELFDGMGSMGALEDTVVVIVGDHGESFGERGGERQHLKVLNREVTHVPAVIVAPNLAPSRVKGYRQQIDLLPTVTELLGLRVEGGYLSGSSLLAADRPDRHMFHATHQPQTLLAAYRDGLKFIYSYRRVPMMAYDTRNDPLELHNIAASLPQTLLDDAETEMLVWSARTRLDMIQQAKR